MMRCKCQHFSGLVCIYEMLENAKKLANIIWANRANFMKTCLGMLMRAIISEIWYYEQVLVIEDIPMSDKG